jgi:hypothetical protein
VGSACSLSIDSGLKRRIWPDLHSFWVERLPVRREVAKLLSVQTVECKRLQGSMATKNQIRLEICAQSNKSPVSTASFADNYAGFGYA